ncbi:thioesterase family protein [Rhodococcus sp. As11]|uniref:thioesterase family protein n=1 Tax=Rhodococcus sp. As11 TaxID=3029189 RepID=UPI003B7E2BFD
MSYFERLGPTSFRATEHVGGAWNEAEQHIAPALGLIAHVIECDRDTRRDDGLVIGRLSYDILGTVPVGPVVTTVEVLRPGRTIELVEATLAHDGRAIVRARAWLMQTRTTAEIAGTVLQSIPSPEDSEPWDPRTLWPGGFIDSVEVRRTSSGPGRASFWVRTPLALVDGEKVSGLAATAGLFDIANGMAVRADPSKVAFPNLDLTAHLFTEPRGEWVGFDTSVSFGADGIGLTSTVLHDTTGPIGTMSQILTVRPI